MTFRRLSSRAAVLGATAAKSPLNTTTMTTTRGYFYLGGGECGIWGATMKKLSINIWIAMFIGVGLIYKQVFCDYSTHRQFIQEATEIWDDDGSGLEGEEAFANLRIYRERIMPMIADGSEDSQ